MSRGSDFDPEAARSTCLAFLQAQVKAVMGQDPSLEQLGLATSVHGQKNTMKVEVTAESLTIFPFTITRGMLRVFHDC